VIDNKNFVAGMERLERTPQTRGVIQSVENGGDRRHREPL
jgi:hypothetical protein